MKHGEKYKLYREERKNGLTYQQIADKYGVSKQTVGQACRVYNPNLFRPVSAERCIYVNLRTWMNKHKVGIAELTRRMGIESSPSCEIRTSNLLKGKFYPRKPHIDKLIELTELTYEQLFEIG